MEQLAKEASEKLLGPGAPQVYVRPIFSLGGVSKDIGVLWDAVHGYLGLLDAVEASRPGADS